MSIMKKYLSNDYLDLRNKYIRDIYELYQHRTLYFTRHLAHNSYPSKLLVGEPLSSLPVKEEMCYVYVVDGIAHIYAHPFQIYCQLLKLTPQQLANPCHQTVQFLANLYNKHQQIEGTQRSQIIIQKILGPSSANTQFIQKHLKVQGKEKKVSDYDHQDMEALKKYNEKHQKKPLAYEQFLGQRQKLMSIIPSQYGEDRLQPIIKLGRQLMPMYGLEVLGNKDWQKGKKILIKCDAIELREYPDDFYSSLGLARPPLDHKSSHVNLTLTSIVQGFTKLFRSPQSESQIQEEFQQYNRLKIKLMKQLTQQLLEYQFLTNSQYPNLHHDYIRYNTKSDHFTLTPVPIILSGLGFHSSQEYFENFHDQCYYQKNLFADMGWSCESKTSFSNVWKVVMLMHYFEMGNFQDQAHLAEKSKNPREWLKLLFGMTAKQIEIQLNQLKNQLLLFKENRKQYQEYLLQKQSYAKTILLLFLSSPKIVPSLASLCQLFPINQRISSVSSSRHEHLLYLRFKSVRLMHDLHVKIVWDINKWYQDNNTDHEIFQKQNRINLQIIEVVMFLVGMQLRDVFREGDQVIQKETEIVLGDIFNNVEQMVTNFTKLSFFSNFYQYLTVVTTKLGYMYKHSKMDGKVRPQTTMLYSKIVKKILNYMGKQEKMNKNGKLYDKFYQNKDKNNLQFIRPIMCLLISLILKMENSNLHWCEYFVYRKIKQLIEGDQIGRSEIKELQSMVDKRGCNEDQEWMIWGKLWPQEDNDHDEYY